MPSPFTTTCWPKQFLAKWFAVFFGALAVGFIVSALIHRQAAPEDIQASVKVLVQYGGQANRSTMADVSTVDGPGGKWDGSKVFPVGAGGTQKTLLGGQTKYFKVWPKNSQGQYEGDPQDWTVKWPDIPRQSLTCTVARSYPKPNWHH